MANITRVATHTWVDGSGEPLDAGNLNELETDITAVFGQANTARTTAEAAVPSAFGRTGAIVAVAGDYTADLVYAAEQLDYACDLSGVTTTIDTSGTSLDVAGGLGISCPATGTNRSLIVSCGGAFQVTAAGGGTLALQIYETTTGSAVLVGVSQVVGGFLLGTGSAFPSAATVSYDLGPTSTERQFKLMCAMSRDAASALAAKVRSSSTGVVKAWIEGMAR